MEDTGVLLVMVPLSLIGAAFLIYVASSWVNRRIKAARAAPGFRQEIEDYSTGPVRNAGEIHKDKQAKPLNGETS
jgi:hypothetical protein